MWKSTILTIFFWRREPACREVQRTRNKALIRTKLWWQIYSGEYTYGSLCQGGAPVATQQKELGTFPELKETINFPLKASTLEKKGAERLWNVPRAARFPSAISRLPKPTEKKKPSIFLRTEVPFLFELLWNLFAGAVKDSCFSIKIFHGTLSEHLRAPSLRSFPECLGSLFCNNLKKKTYICYRETAQGQQDRLCFSCKWFPRQIWRWLLYFFLPTTQRSRDVSLPCATMLNARYPLPPTAFSDEPYHTYHFSHVTALVIYKTAVLLLGYIGSGRKRQLGFSEDLNKISREA